MIAAALSAGRNGFQTVGNQNNQVGVSHIAQLGSQENICAEKLDIVKGLPDDGLIFLNGDDPFLIPYRGKLDKKVFYYGMAADCDYRAENNRTRDRRTSFLFCCNEAAGKKIPVTLGTMYSYFPHRKVG